MRIGPRSPKVPVVGFSTKPAPFLSPNQIHESIEKRVIIIIIIIITTTIFIVLSS